MMYMVNMGVFVSLREVDCDRGCIYIVMNCIVYNVYM